MQRSATLAGPGTARSPSTHLRTVRSSTSSANAAARCDSSRAATASRNCSGDTAHNARRVNRHAGIRKRGAQSVNGFVNAERIGQRTVNLEQRQAFGPIIAAGNEADCIGGKGGACGGFEHALFIGPLGLSCKGVCA
jgi:hypothetical protein